MFDGQPTDLVAVALTRCRKNHDVLVVATVSVSIVELSRSNFVHAFGVGLHPLFDPAHQVLRHRWCKATLRS